MAKLKKIFTLLLILFISISVFKMPANAASISVSAPGTVSPGETFTVSINVGSLGGNFIISTSGGFSASQSSVWLEEGGATSISVTAPGSGSGSISVSGSGLMDLSNGSRVDSASGSAYVTVQAPTPPPSNGEGSTGGGSGGSSSNSGGGSSGGSTNTPAPPSVNQPVEDPKSTNNNLSGLTVSTGSLSPEFSVDVTEYTVSLPADATSISVDATAEDSKATVNGTGEHSLKAGSNEIIINVVAENGDAKNYYVRVNVDETPLVYTTYNDQKLGVVRNTDEIGIPSTFEETTVTLDGQEVIAWHSAQMNKTIVFLVNDAGEKNFYLFEDGKVTSIFKSVALLGRNFYMVDVPSDKREMEGLTFGEVAIKDEKFNGWTFDDEAFSNYSIIYLMDEMGNTHYYQYEKTEDTLQLYSMTAPLTQDEVSKLNEKISTQQMIIYALIATTVVGGGLAAYAFYQLVQTRKNSGYSKKFNYTDDNDLEG